MKYFASILFFFLTSQLLFSQGGEIKGTLKDESTGETIVGATILVSNGKGVTSDIDGNFSIKIDSAGQYSIIISYVGYDPQVIKVKVGNKAVVVNASMQNKTLDEVEVVADVAKIRETPIAFSNISAKQIKEELGTRDLPMVLNSTPGVYATEQGGGSGDARVNLRGFDQRNIAVMLDGVPVNDMENGQVYWSNWDGLGDITRTMQVQRGLGASKLAIASVGGTINTISLGIDQKMGGGIRQEVNDYGLYKTSFGYNSGQLKGGWGVTLAGARKWGNEWADATYTDAWSYFLKIQKRFEKQLFSISANGAPQSHGQRYDHMPVGIYNKKLSDNLGINTDSIYDNSVYTTYTQGERGLTYNPNWGKLDNDGGTSDGTIGFFPRSKHGNVFNERVNHFHKPQFNLSHFWTPNEQLSVSTILYLSIGHGGGTALKVSGIPRDSTNGLLDAQSIYDNNMHSSPNIIYNASEHPSNNYLRSANNDHFWYGIISSWNYKINDKFSTLFGIDARSYKGSHYQSVYNLMGGDYAIDASDKNQPVGAYLGDPNSQYAVKRVGDKVSYYNDSKVYWAGFFGQAEYKYKNLSTFITGSVSETAYQRIDYFRKKDLVLADTTISQVIGWADNYTYQGVTYNRNSPEAKTSTTKRKWFLGYTIKGGANYNLNDHNNIFMNLGYLNMAPLMNTVFDNNNHLYLNIKNQKVYAIELGYGFHQHKFAANVNAYYTIWQNKPLSGSTSLSGTTVYYNILGLNALHKGIELDVIYKILPVLDIEGVVSIGDWKTTSGSKADITDDNGTLITSIDFSAKNVHVGDAAQIQLVGSLKYTVFKKLYIKPRYTYFAKNYSNFDPLSLVGNFADHDSWKMPNYGLLDLYLGYDINYKKMNFGITAGIVNVLDAVYISDGINNGDMNHKNFDATSATVYMGMGRRFNIGLRIGF